MKTLQLLLLTGTVFLLMNSGNLAAQKCDNWSAPQVLSDSLSDNRNAVLARIHSDGYTYYVFWERTLDALGSEIVYTDFYNLNVPETLVSGNAAECLKVVK